MPHTQTSIGESGKVDTENTFFDLTHPKIEKMPKYYLQTKVNSFV